MSVSPTQAPEPGDAVNLTSLASSVLRQRRVVLAFAVLIPLVVVLVSLLTHPTYTTSASFVPQQRRASLGGGLSGVAAQFGLAIPGVDVSQSPQFYADLMKSRPMLGSLVDATYDVQADTGRARGTLVAILQIDGKTPLVRREDAIVELGRMITVSPQVKTGVVKFLIKSRSAQLSAAIATRMLAELNRFNLASRTTQATSERTFTEQRLGEAKSELDVAEDALRSFLQTNRAYQSAPALSLQQERLQRNVTLKQQLYSTLAQAYEQARIEEVRDTPVLSVLEPPYVPVRYDARGTFAKALGGLIIGTAMGLLFGLMRDRRNRRDAAGADPFLEYLALRRETMSDITHPWRILHR
jgi:uncharacterized protein involved in exopolysaccharide biosynthesis